ncbi:MAG: cell division protein FtsA, partial [Oceanospirillaceae bacterium]
TGMDVRIGYPNEHLAKGNPEEVSGPIFSTGVGLVIHGLEYQDKMKRKAAKNPQPIETVAEAEIDQPEEPETEEETGKVIPNKRPGWFTNFTEKIRDILTEDDDNI